eukprot:754528-Hanusia_phi.AAC.1
MSDTSFSPSLINYESIFNSINVMAANLMFSTLKSPSVSATCEPVLPAHFIPSVLRLLPSLTVFIRQPNSRYDQIIPSPAFLHALAPPLPPSRLGPFPPWQRALP